MPRLEFSNKTKRAAFERSTGFCECARVPDLRRPMGCGVRLADGQVRYEHIVQDAIRRDNSLDNCAALTLSCWREKTAKHDLPIIAKSNRVRDRARGIKRRRAGSSFLTNRDGKWKKKMDGSVVRRNA